MKEMKESVASIKLLRHHLGSIDLSDVEGKELTESERRDYCAAIHAVFPRLKKDIESVMYAQLLFAVKKSEDWDQVMFSRGVFDGFALLLEKWTQAHTEHLNQNQNQDFDQNNPLSEV